MAKIYVKPWRNTDDYNWFNTYEIPFSKFSITETDYENKTATFTSSQNINIRDSSYAVKIVDDNIPTFTGLILSKEKRPNESFTYTCQDWNRLYMNKPTMNEVTGETYEIIKKLLSYSEYNTLKPYAGLLSKNKYEQSKYGSLITFNPMKNKKPIGGNDKTQKEWIEYLIYSQHPYIRIHYDQVGTMLFTPYYFNDWLKPIASLHYSELIDFTWNFDFTNVQRGSFVNGKYMNVSQLFNSNTNPLFNQIDLNSSYRDDTNSKNTTKSSSKNNKTSNPYNTKSKSVWVSMDNWQGGQTDRTYFNKVCKELKKHGWKVHKIGIGPQTHDEIHISRSKAKNGVWLMLYGGVDAGCIRETCFDTSFKNVCLKRNLRPVIGFNSTADIRRGGNGFKRIRKAWDDNYSAGDTTIRYPAGCLAYCGVPFVQVPGNHPVKLAQIFCNGGDSKIALSKKYKRIGKGYYANFNWGSKY